MRQLIDAALELSQRCTEIAPKIGSPLEWVYNPLDYAWDVHESYLSRFGGLGANTILLGMNPGPWGMGQTGVPFGDVVKVVEYLGLEGKVGTPDITHPKRPVIGLESTRREVSGSRLWSLIEDIYGDAKEAHRNLFVVNHCPLLMFDSAGRNLTPDKLRAAPAKEMLAACDKHLEMVAEALSAERVVGVGAYAEKRALGVFETTGLEVLRIPHPSPANPFSNRNGGADWRTACSDVLGI